MSRCDQSPRLNFSDSLIKRLRPFKLNKLAQSADFADQARPHCPAARLPLYVMRKPLMSTATSASDVLQREFLEMRAKILELAASLDRIDRADGSVADDPRRQLIERGIAALAETSPGRAERVQLIFSLPYQDGWRKQMAINERR